MKHAPRVHHHQEPSDLHRKPQPEEHRQVHLA